MRAIAVLAALALIEAGLAPGAFGASAYPDRPIRLVVPSTPGGGTDLSMRVVAPKLAELLEQQVVIDNRGGAAGNIGAEIVAKAPPDGYTLLAVIASPEEFREFMRGESKKWAKVIRDAKIQPE